MARAGIFGCRVPKRLRRVLQTLLPESHKASVQIVENHLLKVDIVLSRGFRLLEGKWKLAKSLRISTVRSFRLVRVRRKAMTIRTMT